VTRVALFLAGIVSVFYVSRLWKNWFYRAFSARQTHFYLKDFAPGLFWNRGKDDLDKKWHVQLARWKKYMYRKTRQGSSRSLSHRQKNTVLIVWCQLRAQAKWCIVLVKFNLMWTGSLMLVIFAWTELFHTAKLDSRLSKGSECYYHSAKMWLHLSWLMWTYKRYTRNICRALTAYASRSKFIFPQNYAWWLYAIHVGRRYEDGFLYISAYSGWFY